MSTPSQPPQGSGPQDWPTPSGAHASDATAPGTVGAPQYGSAHAPQYGQAGEQVQAGEYGQSSQFGQPEYGQQAAPSPQYGSAHAPQYGQPGQQGQYGQPAFGSAPAQSAQPAAYGAASYGSVPQGAAAYGSAPHAGAPQGSAPMGYSQPGAGQPDAAPQGYAAQGYAPQSQQPLSGAGPRTTAERRPGSVAGPLSIRDLGLMAAAVLAFLGMLLPYFRFGYGYFDAMVFSWSFWGLGMILLGVVSLLVAGVLTLLHKVVPGFPARVGSYTIAQVTTVLVSVSFAVNFIQLITSAPYLHVGAWIIFIASLIGFFVGVFTFLPFLGAEYASLPVDDSVPPKARGAAVAAQPRPAAPMGGQSQYGAQGQAYGSQGQAQFGSQGQAYGSQRAQYGSSAPAYGAGAPTYGSQGQQSVAPAAFGAAAAAPEAQGIAQTEQAAAQSDALSGTPAADTPQTTDPDATARFSPVDAAPEAHEQSTADGQAYLGGGSAATPAHAQSEPTQAFAGGAFDRGAFGTPEPTPLQDDVAVQDDAAAADSSALDDPAPYSGGVSAAEAPTPAADTVVAEADAPIATGPYVTEDTVGAEPVVEETQTEPVADTFAASESSTADETATGAEHTIGAESSAADEQAATGTSATGASAAAAAGAGAAAESAAGTHLRGDEQGEAENEPTQFFRVGETRTDEVAEESSAAESSAGAAPYDATQGEPTQAFNPVASKMFWFAVPEPRPAVDPVTGREVFTVTPNQWFLALEDHGTFFKVRDDQGQEGYLNNVDRIVRG